MDEAKKSRLPLVTVLIVVVVSAFSYSFARQFFNRAPDVDRALVELSSELNKRMPIVVDKETRLDSTAPSPSKTLSYQYTLVNFDGVKVEEKELAEIRTRAQANYQTNPAMKSLREMGVTLRYRYKNKSGAFVGEFSLTPKDF